MPNLSKFVRVAVEGSTTDGREIQRQWIEDMAASYNPATFGARVNCEHFRSIYPDSPLRCYGDVVALKTEEFEVLGEKRLALLAQIDAHDELVRLSADKQKVYFSVEISPDFAGSGMAYLSGIAITDTPASLGTEMLTFAAQAKINPFANRKTTPDTLFSAALEAELSFEAATPEATDSLVSKIVGAIKLAFAKPAAEAAPAPAPDQTFTEQFANQLGEQIGQLFSKQEATVTDLKKQLTQLSDEFAALKTQLSLEPADPAAPPRTPATGGTGDVKTDC